MVIFGKSPLNRDRLLRKQGGIRVIKDQSVQESGQIILPNHDLYNKKRSVWNTRINRFPTVIFECKSEADVQSAVRFSVSEDLKISIRGGGHHVAGTAVCDHGVMIDLSNMKKVRVDEINRIAYVEAGATLADVDAETQKYGLATPTGTVSETGIAGLSLGGGFGYLRAKYGLTCDNLVGARMITTRGELINVNQDEHPDLFWAIRGGGGNFGVVTEFQFQLHPVGPEVLAIDVMYDYDDLELILDKLEAFTEAAPDDVSVNLSIIKLPPAPFIPESLHFKRVILIAGMYVGNVTEDIKQTVIKPLGHLAQPIVDNTATMPYTDVQKKLDQMVPNGVPVDGTSLFLNTLSKDAIGVLKDAVENPDAPFALVQLWPLHGKINRVPEHDTAFAIRDARYLFIVDAEVSKDQPRESIEWVQSIYENLLPYAHKRASYINGIKVSPEITEKAYQQNYEKLAAIKKKYDPTNRLCYNHNIEPK